MKFDLDIQHTRGDPGERVCTTVKIEGPNEQVRVLFKVDKELVEEQIVTVEGPTFLEFFWTMAPGDNKVDVQLLAP